MTLTINRRPHHPGAAPGSPARVSYLPELDGLRALAVAAVVAEHAGLPVAGGYGVTVFFVLSGYLITALLLAEHATRGRIDLRAFYRRRVARLAPALLTVLSVTVLWLLAISAPIEGWWGGLLGGLTYSTNVLDAVAPTHVGTYFEYCWSLAVEEQFYLIWPVLLILLLRRGRRSRRTLAIICALAVATSWAARAIMIAQHASGKVISFSFPSHVDALAWGALIALLVPRTASSAPARAAERRWSPVLAVALGTLIVSARFGRPLGDMARVDPNHLGVTAMLAAIAVWACITSRGGRVGAVLRCAPLAHLGRLSYALYLWNMLALHAFLRLTGLRPADAGWDGLLWLVGLIAIAEICYRTVERPLRARWAGAPPGS